MGLRGPAAKPVAERFSQKTVAAANGCIEWTAGTNGVGYGIVHLGPDEGSRKVYAHRWSYEQHVGPIPDGLHLDHLCRNTICVNPDHLEPVTPEENILRGISWAAVNARKTHCPKGHPYSGDNLYVRPGAGNRACRTCCRERDRARSPRRRPGKA